MTELKFLDDPFFNVDHRNGLTNLRFANMGEEINLLRNDPKDTHASMQARDFFYCLFGRGIFITLEKKNETK